MLDRRVLIGAVTATLFAVGDRAFAQKPEKLPRNHTFNPRLWASSAQTFKYGKNSSSYGVPTATQFAPIFFISKIWFCTSSPKSLRPAQIRAMSRESFMVSMHWYSQKFAGAAEAKTGRAPNAEGMQSGKNKISAASLKVIFI